MDHNTSSTSSNLNSFNLSCGLSNGPSFQPPAFSLLTTSPQGKFVQRLFKVELDNKILRDEITELKNWKSTIETWILDAFGVVPGETSLERSQTDFLTSDLSTTNTTAAYSSISTNPPLGDTHDTIPLITNKSDNTNGVKVEKIKQKIQRLSQPGQEESAPISGSNQPVHMNGQAKDAVKETSTPLEIASSSGEKIISVAHKSTIMGKRPGRRLKIKFPKFPLPKGRTNEANNPPAVEASDCEEQLLVRQDSTSIATTKNLIKQKSPGTAVLPSEENPGDECESEEIIDATPCDICHYHLPENQNNMIYCEKCNLCVHQACYGIPEIPTGEWNCQACTANIPVSEQKCRFCPTRGGAMVRVKSPSKTTWAHVSCTWWIPGVNINNPSLMDMVVGLPNVEKGRWNLLCSICMQGKGTTCCVQCCYRRCRTAFHVTCALKEGYRMDMVDTDNDANPNSLLLYPFCVVHRDKPIEKIREQNTGKSPQKKRRKFST